MVSECPVVLTREEVMAAGGQEMSLFPSCWGCQACYHSGGPAHGALFFVKSRNYQVV